MPIDGGGDPYIDPIEGEPYEMTGSSGRRYNVLTLGDMKFYARIGDVPGLDGEGRRTRFVGCDLYVPEGAEATLNPDGSFVVTFGAWSFAVVRKICRIAAEAHASPPVIATTVVRTTGHCDVYAGLETGVHVYGRETETHWNAEACSLDAPGHAENSQDAWHPLQGVPHVNFHIDHPADIGDATGLAVRHLPPDTDWEQFAVEG